MKQSKTQVLIVGAGPSGLVQALWLQKKGVPFRLIDKNQRPGETSRALAVQARTLEFYRQLGIADKIIQSGITAKQIMIRRNGKVVARAKFGALGEGISPYPYLLFCSQDVHEAALCEILAAGGGKVERETELVSFSQDQEGVRALVRGPAGEEEISAQYLVGCDGAHSSVRHGLGIDFPGGTYSQVFFVADVVPSQPMDELGVQVSVSMKDFCIIMPIQLQNTTRLTGTVPPENEAKEKITFEHVAEAVQRSSGVKAQKVNWFSTYHVHHRVAHEFRKGRAFLVGDAAHIHSPAGGQGMNTGIGDSINLAWKLADVIQGRAQAHLLDSYAPERQAFAKVLVATTDQAFRVLASQSLVGRLFRAYVIPTLFSLLVKFRAFLRFAFLTVSQTRIQYRASSISQGVAGTVHGGDRLPWVSLGASDNFEPLQAMGWQVHVYGEANSDLFAAATARKIPLHAFPWREEMLEKGLQKNAMYLVRPDGYVALAYGEQDVRVFSRYVHEIFN